MMNGEERERERVAGCLVGEERIVKENPRLVLTHVG